MFQPSNAFGLEKENAEASFSFSQAKLLWKGDLLFNNRRNAQPNLSLPQHPPATYAAAMSAQTCELSFPDLLKRGISCCTAGLSCTCPHHGESTPLLVPSEVWGGCIFLFLTEISDIVQPRQFSESNSASATLGSF